MIEAELVDAPTKAIFPVTSKKKEHTFSQVVVLENRSYKRVALSDREKKFVQMVIKKGEITAACAEVGISKSTGLRYMKRPMVREYIQQQKERAAKAADLTFDKVAASLSQAMDGVGEIDQMQLQATIAASRFLNPSGGAPGSVNITNNTQNNYGGGVSPFADMTQAEMEAELKRGLLEMGGE